MFEPGADLFITGETGEVCAAEYIRDACFFGENKAVIILGHYSSEYAGMRLLAEELNETFGNTVFLDSKEVYHGI
jgi:putative NIF3 family GTP cyclohydrolase 1 type 2